MGTTQVDSIDGRMNHWAQGSPGRRLVRARRNHGIREPNGPDRNSPPPEPVAPNPRKRQTQSASTYFESAAVGNRASALVQSAPGKAGKNDGGSGQPHGPVLVP